MTDVASLPGKPAHNPWRTFVENCISGDNYFRSSEYYKLLDDLDRLYALEESALAARSPAPSAGVGTCEALAWDLATNGLRFDTTPCLDWTSKESIHQFWSSYFRRADESIRERAERALSQHPAAPSVSPAVAGDGLPPEFVTCDDCGTPVEAHCPKCAAASSAPQGEQPGSAVQGEVVGDIRIQDGCIVSTSIKCPLADGGYDVVPQSPTPPAPAAEQGQCNHDEADVCPKCELRWRSLTERPAATQPEARGVEGMVLVKREELEHIRDGLCCDIRQFESDPELEDANEKISDLVSAMLTTPNPVRAEQPEGKWKLVPVEPTQAMLDAGVDAGVKAAPDPWCPKTWAAMLASAPAAPGAAPSGVRVNEAARALVAKIEAIHSDPRYQGVWVCAHNHGQPYTGPTYEAELAILTAALAGKDGVA